MKDRITKALAREFLKMTANTRHKAQVRRVINKMGCFKHLRK